MQRFTLPAARLTARQRNGSLSRVYLSDNESISIFTAGGAGTERASAGGVAGVSSRPVCLYVQQFRAAAPAGTVGATGECHTIDFAAGFINRFF